MPAFSGLTSDRSACIAVPTSASIRDQAFSTVDIAMSVRSLGSGRLGLPTIPKIFGADVNRLRPNQSPVAQLLEAVCRPPHDTPDGERRCEKLRRQPDA